MISEYTSSTEIYFEGQTGYKNFVGYLNVLASKYENSKYTIGSRYVGYNGQTEYLTDTANTVDSTSTTAPWTCSTGRSCNPTESQGGGDTLYQNDYDLMENVLGTVVANKVGTSNVNSYWMTSRYYGYLSSTFWDYYACLIYTDGNLNGNSLYRYSSSSFITYNGSYALRPIVILKSEISYTPALGTSENPLVLN